MRDAPEQRQAHDLLGYPHDIGAPARPHLPRAPDAPDTRFCDTYPADLLLLLSLSSRTKNEHTYVTSINSQLPTLNSQLPTTASKWWQRVRYLGDGLGDPWVHGGRARKAKGGAARDRIARLCRFGHSMTVLRGSGNPPSSTLRSAAKRTTEGPTALHPCPWPEFLKKQSI